jgi:integrase
MDEGWRTTNPASGLRIGRSAARTRVWTPDELARLKIAAVAAGKPSVALAVELAYDLGQRIGDVLRLTWSQWSGSEFALTQTKRKAKVAIPVLSNDLLGRLNSMERKGVQIVLSEVTGRPYAYGAFRSAFARIRKAADLPPDLQVRDTRRTALIEAGDGGGTDDQIRSLSGHRNRKSVESYVHPTSTMAADAQAARERARNRSGKTATKEQK